MANRPRQFIAGKVYELEIRTREGLPFACLKLVELLLKSAMARAQRDSKVTITHFLWMGNHLHLLFIAKDAELAANFYAEIMKKITDYYKCLFGLSQLELWDPRGAVVSQVLDVKSLKDRIAYIFANPSRAHLVDTISQYPGFSSWETIDAVKAVTEDAPWIRQPAIEPLSHYVLDERQDRFMTAKLRDTATISHEFTVDPSAAYRAFGVKEEGEIQALNAAVKEDIESREADYRERRVKDGKKVLGPGALKRQSLRRAHTPKRDPSDRRILFHTTVKELALEFLAQFDAFCHRCKDAYLAWRNGDYTAEWPPGAFRPPMRPVANAIGW